MHPSTAQRKSRGGGGEAAPSFSSCLFSGSPPARGADGQAGACVREATKRRAWHEVRRRAFPREGRSASHQHSASPPQVDITLLCPGGAKRSPRRGPDRGRSDNARYRTGHASDVTGPFEADGAQHGVTRAGRGACSPGCPGEERSDEGRPPPPLGAGGLRASKIRVGSSLPPGRCSHGSRSRAGGRRPGWAGGRPASAAKCDRGTASVRYASGSSISSASSAARRSSALVSSAAAVAFGSVRSCRAVGCVARWISWSFRIDTWV